MMLYREKVEHQKKLREKFVQMKEEQRLKNQMQSFIQNNIKGKNETPFIIIDLHLSSLSSSPSIIKSSIIHMYKRRIVRNCQS